MWRYFNVTHLLLSHGIPADSAGEYIYIYISEKCFDIRTHMRQIYSSSFRNKLQTRLSERMLFQQPVPETISHIMFAVVTEGWLRKRKAGASNEEGERERRCAGSCREQTDFLPKSSRNSVAHCTSARDAFWNFFSFLLFFFSWRTERDAARDGV